MPDGHCICHCEWNERKIIFCNILTPQMMSRSLENWKFETIIVSVLEGSCELRHAAGEIVCKAHSCKGNAMLALKLGLLIHHFLSYPLLKDFYCTEIYFNLNVMCTPPHIITWVTEKQYKTMHLLKMFKFIILSCKFCNKFTIM